MIAVIKKKKNNNTQKDEVYKKSYIRDMLTFFKNFFYNLLLGIPSFRTFIILFFYYFWMSYFTCRFFKSRNNVLLSIFRFFLSKIS